MTTQERIAQLSRAALRSAPEPTGAPKPAVPLTSFDRQAHVAPAPQPEPVPVAIPAPQAAPAPFKDEPDQAFRDMLDEREAKRKRQHSIRNRVLVTGVFLALASLGAWVAVSPKAQAKLSALVHHLKQSGKDVKSLGSITGQYDEKLKKVTARSEQIDGATRAMGVDPATADPKQDPHMDAEMRKLMGDGATTTLDRNNTIQQKFGFVGKAAGRDGVPAGSPQSGQ